MAPKANPQPSSADPDLLQQLHEMAGDMGSGTAREALSTFLRLLPERLDQLRSPDLEARRHVAHTLKGSAGFLRAHALADAARRLEAGDAGDEDLEVLLDTIDLTAATMEAYLEESAG